MNTQSAPVSRATQTDLLPEPLLLEQSVRVVTRSAATLAAFCEHVEHNEASDVSEVVSAAERLRSVAAQLTRASGCSLAEIYTHRIRAVEKASLFCEANVERRPVTAGADALSQALTWDAFQLAQIVHDRQFHPDVFGLSKVDQLRHYTFHVTKLAGLFLDAIDLGEWQSFKGERLADLAIFGVKIATVCNERLPSDQVG